MTILRLGKLAGFIIALISVSSVAAWQSQPATTAAQIEPKWVVSLPTRDCNSAALQGNCHVSSPVVADMNRDGRQDVVVATNKGHVLAVSGNGTVLWDRDTAPLFGRPGGSQSIASSPAVADLDGDGTLEVVVGTGVLESGCTPGGVVVLDSAGRKYGNWPISTYDNNIPPSNCPDPVFATPAVGDLDNDGDLEIVVGSFDTRIYAWHHDGSRVNGFPSKSHLYDKYGWANMRENLADTVWSSPALADMDGDGYLDIVIGTDEGDMDSRNGGLNWTCPYRLPSNLPAGYCGGALYAYDRHGEFLPGYPRQILEIIQSSPAIVDGDGDGQPEVFVGTGSFYRNVSPDRPTYGFRVFGWQGDGGEVPGWEGGRPTSNVVPGSPAIGNIAGDSRPEIVVPGLGGKLYAWHHNGARVAGFPMTPLNLFGSSSRQDVGKGVVLGDYDGDGMMEIFLTLGWSVVVIDGDGRILTNTNFPDDQSSPFYYTDGLFQNNPTLGDIDQDGQLELIAHNSKLYAWDMPSGAVQSDWPAFRGDAARTGTMLPRTMSVTPRSIETVLVARSGQESQQTVTIRVPGTEFDWSLDITSSGGAVSSPSDRGTARNRADVAVTISVPPGSPPGIYNVGHIDVSAAAGGQTIQPEIVRIPVQLTLIRAESDLFMPVVRSGSGQ